MKLPHRRQFLHLAAAALPGVALRLGASLSGAAGADHRRLCRWWQCRHHRTHDGAMAVGAARPTIRRRKPHGCCDQYRHGGGCEVTARWPYAPLRHFGKRDQPTVYEKLNFKFMRDIAPVAATTRSPLVLEVHPAFSANTLTEFISYAKANPGKISLASFGTATVSHLAGELFKAMAGINLTWSISVALA